MQRIGEVDAGDHAKQHVVGAVEFALLDAGDHVGDLGLRAGRSHLAALHLVEHLLGLEGCGVPASKPLPLHQAE